jgi:hypothetical protein
MHELTARGVVFESGDLIMKLKGLLREHLGDAKAKTFTPVSDQLINAVANKTL